MLTDLAELADVCPSAPSRTARFLVLVIQTGSSERLMAAAEAVKRTYPGAHCHAWVKPEDFDIVRSSGLFAKVKPMTAQAWPPPVPIPNLCVLPFDDRFGIRYWNLRNMPLRAGIQRIASYGRTNRLQEFSRPGWRANTMFACTALRLVQICIQALRLFWYRIRHFVDVGVLFALAGAAFVTKAAWSLKAKGEQEPPVGPRSVVLFIPSLGMGGAQRQLLSYLRHIDRRCWRPEVVTINTLDKFFVADFESLGIPVTYFEPNRRLDHVGLIWQLVKYLRSHRCAVLHNWLHYAVALGAIAGGLAGVPVIVGSLRSERPGRFPWFYPKWQRAIDVLTGPLQTAMIANSKAVKEDNRKWALLPKDKLVTIYNGIETEGFPRLDEAMKTKLKAELHLPLHQTLVGIVGRIFPEKDHATFLVAAERVLQSIGDVVFLIVGDGTLRPWVECEIARRNLSERVRVLGERKDAKQIMQILDVLVLTSISEGLPNVLLEGAVSGVAAVTTAAGGAAEVVVNGETGFVVPCGHGQQVGERIVYLLKNPQLRTQFGEAARRRAQACFEPHAIARMIESTYLRGASRSQEESSR